MDPLDNIEIAPNFYFPCGVYTFRDDRHLEAMRAVSDDYLAQATSEGRGQNEVYPVCQTYNFAFDDRIEDFRTVLGHAAWKILDSQGYNMDPYNISVTELWCQEHRLHSGHDVHIHGNGGQLCGFYFLDGEKDSVRAFIHDPNWAKVYANLPQKDDSIVTPATTMVNFIPEPGTFMLMNTWLPHSFSRNKSKTPFRFIHFNLGVVPRANTGECLAEVI